MKTVYQRVQIALALIILLVAVGAAAGYLVGRVLILRQAETRLAQYATRILGEGEASSQEARSLLAQLNASPYPYCSDAEIQYFRGLIFRSEYLRDAGRMRDGKIGCSATMGLVNPAITAPKPDFSQLDGTKVYKNLAPSQAVHMKRLGLQLGDSYVVFSANILTHITQTAMHYTITVFDAPSGQSGRLAGGLPKAQGQILTSDGQTRVGDTIYVTRCSKRYFSCITTYITVPEVLQSDRGQFRIYLLLGGLAGAVFGLVTPLLYRHNKSIEQQLLRAIRADALLVVYQPIVELDTGRIIEAEALVRWTDEYKNPVGPDVFVKVAEQQGFVGEITKLVVRQVLRDLGGTMRARPAFRVNVNIAAPDLADPEFLPMLEHSLEEAEVSATSLGIEITESYTARQQVAKDTILRLRQKGHYVHIDDFGTGYSSLAYLHDLSVDAIKIDKAFTQAIGTEAVTVSILPQILTMAETLKLRVVVEGIETQAQADYFCNGTQSILAQGWLFGRPVPARMFLQILDENDTTQSGTGLPSVEELEIDEMQVPVHALAI